MIIRCLLRLVVGVECLLETEGNVDCVKELIPENRIIAVCAAANNLEILFG
jgi:hypothetical protein